MIFPTAPPLKTTRFQLNHSNQYSSLDSARRCHHPVSDIHVPGSVTWCGPSPLSTVEQSPRDRGLSPNEEACVRAYQSISGTHTTHSLTGKGHQGQGWARKKPRWFISAKWNKYYRKGLKQRLQHDGMWLFIPSDGALLEAVVDLLMMRSRCEEVKFLAVIESRALSHSVDSDFASTEWFCVNVVLFSAADENEGNVLAPSSLVSQHPYSLHSFGSRLLRMRTFWLGVLKSDVQLTVL